MLGTRVLKTVFTIAIILAIQFWGISVFNKQLRENEAEEHYKLAGKYRDQHDLENAKKELEKTLELNPRHWKSHYAIAWFYEKSSDWDTAIKHLSISTTLSPKSPGPYLALSRCYCQKKDYFTAHSAISTYISLTTKDPNGYYMKGIIYIKQHQSEQAIPNFQSALALGTTDTGYLYYLGYAFSHSHRYDEAINTFLRLDKLCTKENTFGLNYAALGYAYWSFESQNTKLLTEAEHLALKSIERNPDNPDIYFILGLIYRNWGKYKKAVPFYQKGFEVISRSTTQHPLLSYGYVDYGFTLMKLGRKNEAINEIVKALEIKPNNPEALAYLGEIYYEDKKYDKAIELFQKCIAVAPDYNVPYQYLGTYYYYIKYDNMKYQYYWNQYCQLSTHIYIPYE